MVWYIPPLSPVADTVTAAGHGAGDPDQVFAAIEALRVPAEYLANLFTAGDPGPVRRVLRTLAAVRALMRAGQLGLEVPDGLAEAVGAAERGRSRPERPVPVPSRPRTSTGAVPPRAETPRRGRGPVKPDAGRRGEARKRGGAAGPTARPPW
jgi:hypothetical protein